MFTNWRRGEGGRLARSSRSRESQDRQALDGRRQAFDRVQRALDLFLVERDVLEVAGEVIVVRRHVEVAVAGEIEEDRLLLAGLVRRSPCLERAVDRVRRL